MSSYCEVETIIPGLPDYIVNELEAEYKVSLPRLSESQWLEVFPESRAVIAQEGIKSSQRADVLRAQIKDYFDHRPKNGTWFWDEVAKVFWGEDLEKAKNRIAQISFLLRDTKPKNKPATKKIAEVLSRPRLSLVELVTQQGVKLRALNGGTKFVGRCCFHQEKTGSFYIFQDRDRQRFYCFGCGAKGDSVDFLKKVGYGIQESLALLA